MASKRHVQGPKFTKKKDYRPDEVKETGLAFVGHEISEDGKAMNQFLHYDQLYTIRHGWNSKTFIGFTEGKIMGTKCPKCGDAWFPARTHCWRLDCNLQPTDWIEFPKKAKVHTWTVAGWSGRSSLKRLPMALVYAIVEGSKVAIANEVRTIKPWDIEFGQELKIVFKPEAERQGTVADWWFEPVDGWKPGPMNPEKERIKKLVEPVYEWVKTMK